MRNVRFILYLIGSWLAATALMADWPDWDPSLWQRSVSCEFEFNALIVKPSSNNLGYAAEAIPLPLPSPNWNIFEIQPNHRFGFDLGFKATRNKERDFFMLHWERFSSCSASAVSVGSENMVGPFFEIGPDATLYTNALGRVKFHFNEVNIDAGLSVLYRDRLYLDLFGGIGITSIKQILNTIYSSADETTVRAIVTPIHFVGAGPQFGAHILYNFWNDFYIAGKCICSLLVGPEKNYTTYYALSPALEELDIIPPNTQHTCTCKRTLLVPALQEKIGIAYEVSCGDWWTLHLEVGYQAQVYISALQSTDISSEVVTPPVIPDTVGVFARTFHQSVSNFALAGAYMQCMVCF